MSNGCFKGLIILLPFHDLWQPNLAASILKRSLTNAGHVCDVYYANYDFAERIGFELYEEIINQNILFAADLLFAEHLHSETKARCDKIIENTILSKAKPLLKNFIKDLITKIEKGNYTFIGFNANFHTVPCLAVAKHLKKINPHVKTALGGSNTDGEMGIALHENFKYIDFICQGEGENLIVELANKLSTNSSTFESIKGLIWRKENQSIRNGKRSEIIKNLDTVPTPDFKEWFDQVDKYKVDYTELIIHFESSRGCWYGVKNKCLFCGLCAENKTYRVKSHNHVINELNKLHQVYGVNRFFAMDLVFPKQFFKTLLPKIMTQNKGFKLGYEIRATTSKKQLKMLKEANVTFILCGIESLNSNILKNLRKGTKAFHNIRLLKWSLGYGINILWFLLYGCINETEEDYADIAMLIPFISHLQPPKSMNPILLLRFSPLYEEHRILGLERVQVNQHYKCFYNLPETELNKLAYYFEYNQYYNDKINDVKMALGQWQDLVGVSMFFYFEFNGELHFYDSRPVAHKKIFTLSGLEKEIYLVCDAGVMFDTIKDKIPIQEEQLNRLLKSLCKKKIIINIDNRYLSLAVEFSNTLFVIQEIEPALHFYSNIYRNWIISMANK